jgi:hypothetical protein
MNINYFFNEKRCRALMYSATLIGMLNATNAEAVLYNFDSGLGGFQSYGSAASVSGEAKLTLTTGGNGSIFLNALFDATAFNASFDFFIGNGSGSGADGLTFSWVESPGLGSGGGFLGFEGLVGYAVEFDTYSNSWDVNENHIGIAHGTVTSNLITSTVPEMEDTGWHHVDIAFDSGQIQVSVDNVEYINYTIDNYTGFDAHFGFTAGTAAETNEHIIDNFSLTAVPVPAAFWLFGSGVIGLFGYRKSNIRH